MKRLIKFPIGCKAWWCKRWSQVIFFAAFLIVLSELLSGCSGHQSTVYAPVVNGVSQPKSKSGHYQVKSGDTLYSIAWAYGLDYRYLAFVNHLQSPYSIHPGNLLLLSTAKGNSKKVVSFSRRSSRKSTYSVNFQHWQQPVHAWVWPTKGRILHKYAPNLGGNLGIDIAGRLGQPVIASASGIVVYCGVGIRGYGNLIIIKHNNSYLSAYAHNQINLVNEGDRVKSGQVIARLGHNNADVAMLHFEIRRDGRPVNPMKYLR